MITPYGSNVLILPQGSARYLPRGKVLAVGDGSYDGGGTLRAPRVSVNDIVVLRIDFGLRAIKTQDGAGNDAFIVPESDIVGIE
jgi:co-chaperonin GroES (HSP10)